MTDTDVSGLVTDVEDAAKAYIRGDMDAYLALISHDDDYTLMPPLGGPTVHGFDSSAESVAQRRRFFTGGEARVELEQSYVSGDLAVLVAAERQHGQVGGLPDQDWSLRVTLVFRRAEPGWQLVHRHAEPLVRPISFEQTAALARGAG